MSSMDEPDSMNDFTEPNLNRRPSVIPSPPPATPPQQASSPRFFNFGRKRLKNFFIIKNKNKSFLFPFSESSTSMGDPKPGDKQRSALLTVPKNDYVTMKYLII